MGKKQEEVFREPYKGKAEADFVGLNPTEQYYLQLIIGDVGFEAQFESLVLHRTLLEPEFIDQMIDAEFIERDELDRISVSPILRDLTILLSIHKHYAEQVRYYDSALEIKTVEYGSLVMIDPNSVMNNSGRYFVITEILDDQTFNGNLLQYRDDGSFEIALVGGTISSDQFRIIYQLSPYTTDLLIDRYMRREYGFGIDKNVAAMLEGYKKQGQTALR